MKFDFAPVGDTAGCMTKTEIARFERARKGSLKDRRWAKEAISLFADKADLQECQAIQLIRSGEFQHAQAMHSRVYLNIASSMSPERTKKFQEYHNMTNPNHKEMIRRHFTWALSIRHEDDRVSQGMTRTHEVEVARKIVLKHQDETRQAHKKRMEAALAVVINPTQENVRELGASFGL